MVSTLAPDNTHRPGLNQVKDSVGASANIEFGISFLCAGLSQLYILTSLLRSARKDDFPIGFCSGLKDHKISAQQKAPDMIDINNKSSFTKVMNLNVKMLLLLVLIAPGISSFAQKADSFDVHRGVGHFVLGSDKSIYGNTIKFGDSVHYGGITDYFYYHHFETPYTVAGVQFYDVLLTFDSANKLKEIELPKIYTDKLFSNCKQSARRNFNELVKYLKSGWGEIGKKKDQFNQLVAKGYEWSDQQATMWVYLQETKPVIKNVATFYGISIIFIRNHL